ncbi:MAG TPA: DapH/DapD/GlmU-related protein [Bryobacteraceae bacterium]|jgi:acetyltransferase-like isoleucine patch superfamily enzyme|nr:DapH/DapD/GlmU-related protein [Bryobacteraceae bacterium]
MSSTSQPRALSADRTISEPNVGFTQRLRAYLGAAFFNLGLNGFPSHCLRIGFLRLAGMKIGRKVGLLRGTRVMRPDQIQIGNNCIIGFDCFLGGEAGITIGNNVNISSFCVLLGGDHNLDQATFHNQLKPIVIEDYAWIATRATIAGGVRIGKGAVVGTGAVVTRDVPPFAVVVGVPAKKIRERNPEACTYELNYRPFLF